MHEGPSTLSKVFRQAPPTNPSVGEEHENGPDVINERKYFLASEGSLIGGDASLDLVVRRKLMRLDGLDPIAQANHGGGRIRARPDVGLVHPATSLLCLHLTYDLPSIQVGNGPNY
jgi:hypothetical protein